MQPTNEQTKTYLQETLHYYNSPEVKTLHKGFIVTFRPNKAVIKADSSFMDVQIGCASERQVKSLFAQWLKASRSFVGE